jgi:hypothetical protein
MPILTEKIKPYAKPKTFSSIFASREATELPAWIEFDKQVCVCGIAGHTAK